MGDAYQTARQTYINNALEAWRNNQANKPKVRGGKSEAEKTEDAYNRLIKQQKEQIALAGQNTELAKMKYQVSGANYQPYQKRRNKPFYRMQHSSTRKKFVSKLLLMKAAWRTVTPVSGHQMRLSC